MPALPSLPTGDILAIAGNFVFILWFILIVSALTGRRHRLANGLAVWIVLLVIRVFIGVYVYTTPSLSFELRLIPEPLNTYLFIASGLILILAFVVRKNRRATSAQVRGR